MNEGRKLVRAGVFALALMAGSVACGEKGLGVERTEKAESAYLFTAVADGDVWLPNPDTGRITRVDGESGEVRAEIDVREAGSGFNPEPHALATDPDGNIWVPLLRSRAVARIDARTNKVVETVPVELNPYAMTVTRTDLWLSDFEAGVVVRVDRASGREVARLTEVRSPMGIVQAAGDIWVESHREGVVSRIDPDQNAVVDQVGSLGTLHGLAVSEDALWVAATSRAKLVRIGLTTLETTGIELGAPPFGVAVGEDGIWVTTGPENGCDKTNSSAVLIDRDALTELAHLPLTCAFAVGASPKGLAVVGTDDASPKVVSLRWHG